MGLFFEVSGKTVNFKLTEYEIRGYEFSYEVPDSKYAKGHKDHRLLIIKGSIARTLVNNRNALVEIRKWVKTEYTDPSYYSFARVTHIHVEEVIREITFPDAFVLKYMEEIDTHTGDGTYTITLMQKLDKRIDITIEPFNVVFPRLSNLMRESRERREAKRAEEAAAMAGMVAMMAPPPPANVPGVGNSPYWVNNARLHMGIRVINSISLRNQPGRTSTGFNSGEIPSGTNCDSGEIPSGTILGTVKSGSILRIISSRNLNGRTWYNVRPWGMLGWIPEWLVDYSGSRLNIVEPLDENQRVAITFSAFDGKYIEGNTGARRARN